MNKCEICGEQHNTNELTYYNGKYCCERCYVRLKNEGYELQALKNCIQHIFKYKPNKQILNQINKYHDVNGWSYKNIRLTLEYMVVVREMQLEYKYGIGLVPYYYDDMIAFHKKRLAQAEQIKDSKKKSKHVTINKKQEDMHKFNKRRMIDIEGIDEDDE